MASSVWRALPHRTNLRSVRRRGISASGTRGAGPFISSRSARGAAQATTALRRRTTPPWPARAIQPRSLARKATSPRRTRRGRRCRGPRRPRRARRRSSRSRPFSPFFSLRSRSCFSIRVALAKKIEGSARNSPPIAGPQMSAVTPATTVASPPIAKRKANSYQRSSLSVENLNRTAISYPSTIRSRPSATASHTTVAIAVAARADKRARIKSWQTRRL